MVGLGLRSREWIFRCLLGWWSTAELGRSTPDPAVNRRWSPEKWSVHRRGGCWRDTVINAGGCQLTTTTTILF
uniref:Uncharacterized protein n=1 Tax=Medicago truncatula TaxID=3880 RepID=Q2HTG8_MEDTR|nr:hypothetical protein MtrDRAFT_AC150441g21v1 [Medicago truncatula]